MMLDPPLLEQSELLNTHYKSLNAWGTRERKCVSGASSPPQHMGACAVLSSSSVHHTHLCHRTVQQV